MVRGGAAYYGNPYKDIQGEQGNKLNLSGGLGYVSKEFSFDASVRRILGDQGATAFFLGLRYHVESLGISGD